MPNQKFPKSARLTGVNSFSHLMKEGHSFHMSPLRIVWNANDLKQNRLGIAVPKRNFKKAVTRNKLKRRMREAYRKNQLVMAGNLRAGGKCIDLLFIYTGKAESEYKEIELKINASMHKLQQKIKT